MPLISHYYRPLWRAPNCPYCSLPWRPLLIHYNGPLCGKQTALIIALHGGLSLAIIMYRYEGPLTELNIVLHRCFSIAIIMDSYEGPSLPLLYLCIEAST
jgi:hypothetical protein